MNLTNGTIKFLGYGLCVVCVTVILVAIYKAAVTTRAEDFPELFCIVFFVPSISIFLFKITRFLTKQKG